MTAPHAQSIVDGYLRRLDDELRPLPSRRRQEIAEDIRAHIAEARTALAEESDADVLNILDRLGEPAEIAAEARERSGVDEPGDAGPQELLALLLLGVGNIALPLLSWIAGVLLLWRSRCWSDEVKRRGAALGLIGVTLAWLPVVPVLAEVVSGVVPLGVTVFMAVHLGRRLPYPARIGAGVVCAVVVLPVVVALLPSRTHYIVARPAGAASASCGELYVTRDLGGPLGGSAHLNLGFCTDGNRVRISWGPDCPVDSSGLLHVDAHCRLQPQQSGALVVDLRVDARPATSPMFAGGEQRGWVILQDGKVIEP
jgi:hypothetical protein